MGQRTEARIERWQRRAGITPATGARLRQLETLSQLAFELIKVVELERSGIRDGDGQWHGSDVLGAVVREIAKAEQTDLALWKQQSEQHREPGNLIDYAPERIQ